MSVRVAKDKDIRAHQAYRLYITTSKSQTDIAKDFKVARQTVVNWIHDVREAIDEPAIIEQAKKDCANLIPDAIKVFGKAVIKDSVDSIAYNAAKDLLKNSKVLTEAPETQIQVNVSVINEERKEKTRLGLAAFGYELPSQN